MEVKGELRPHTNPRPLPDLGAGNKPRATGLPAPPGARKHSPSQHAHMYTYTHSTHTGTHMPSLHIHLHAAHMHVHTNTEYIHAHIMHTHTASQYTPETCSCNTLAEKVMNAYTHAPTSSGSAMQPPRNMRSHFKCTLTPVCGDMCLQHTPKHLYRSMLHPHRRHIQINRRECTLRHMHIQIEHLLCARHCLSTETQIHIQTYPHTHRYTLKHTHSHKDRHKNRCAHTSLGFFPSSTER